MAYAEAAATGQPLHDTQLAPKCKVSRSQISRWRTEVDGFEDWLEEFCRRIFRRGMAPLLLRAWQLGLKGSIKHMEFFARWSGAVPLDEQPPPLPGGATVHNNFSVLLAVPRPEGTTLPGHVVRQE